MDINYVIKLFSESFNSDKMIRDKAEKELISLSEKDYEKFLNALADILGNKQLEIQIRQLSGIMFKNKITKNKWFELDRDKIKSNLINIISQDSCSNVRKTAAVCIATICRFEIPQQEWTEIFDVLISMVSNNDNMTSITDCLAFICEELTSVGYKNDSICRKIMAFIFDNLADKNSQVSLFKLFYHTLPWLKEIFGKKDQRTYILTTLYNNDIQIDDLVLEMLLKCAIQIATLFYGELLEEIDILANFTFKVVNSEKEDQLKLLAFEFWCCLGDIEIAGRGSLFNDNNKSNNFYQKFADILIKLCLNNIYKESDDDDSWSISKAVCYILAILVQTTDSKYLEELLLYVQEYSKDIKTRKNALLVFSSCLETTNKALLGTLLNYSLLEEFFKYISETDNIKVAITASWVLCKITELYSNVIERSRLNIYIDYFNTLLSSINNNQIRANVCTALCSVITFYGDKETKRNNNALSFYCNTIIENCTRIALNDNSGSTKYPLFEVICCLIKNSSDDFQEQIEELLKQYISIYVDINKKLLENNTNSMLLEFQENLCLVFEHIFTKIKRKVKGDLCGLLFEAIVESFKIRKNIIEIGLYVLSFIAVSKFKILI
jgi:hypothetical protein